MPIIVNAELIPADDVCVCANELAIASMAPQYTFYSDMNVGQRSFGTRLPVSSVNLWEQAIVLFAKNKSAMREALRKSDFTFVTNSTLSLLRGNYDPRSYNEHNNTKEQIRREKRKAARGNMQVAQGLGVWRTIWYGKVMQTIGTQVNRIWQESRVNVVKSGGYYIFVSQQDKLGATVGEA